MLYNYKWVTDKFDSGRIDPNETHFNNTIFDFNFFSKSATVNVSSVALLELLNHPQNNTFFVSTDCTTFQQ